MILSPSAKVRPRMLGLIALAVWWSASPVTMSADAVGFELDPVTDKRFPKSESIVDVTQPPYSAKGDGETDNAAAFQKVIDETTGRHKVIYLPNGIYLVSRVIDKTYPFSLLHC